MSQNFTVAIFSIFFLTYIVVLRILTQKLSAHYPQFYLREKHSIYLSTCTIIIALSLRIGINLMLNFDGVWDALQDSFAHNTWLYPVYFSFTDLIASLIPLGCTLYSLLQMVRHRRHMVERSLDP